MDTSLPKGHTPRPNLTPSSVLACRSIYIRPCKHYVYLYRNNIEILIMNMQSQDSGTCMHKHT